MGGIAMRVHNSEQGLSVRATAGTHTVLLGFDLVDPAGCLGFGIHRTDHTEEEAYWLRGMKVFDSVVPHPTAGMDFSTRRHPVQGFQWGDYTAKPGVSHGSSHGRVIRSGQLAATRRHPFQGET